MKKELLIGTALVSTLGAASVAEAVTATMSGNHQTGLEFDSPTGGSDTRAQINDNNFTVSLSETTDGGMTISSSFMLLNEAGGGSSDEDAGFSLAFTDGSKLDVLNAGNASGSHDISVPGSAGAEGVTVTTGNTAPTGLDFMTGATVYGVEYHSAADFLADGLKMSFSASTDNGAASGATYGMDNHFAFGGTYVTDLGDSAVTVGFGYSDSDGAKTGTQMTADEGGIHVGSAAGLSDDDMIYAQYREAGVLMWRGFTLQQFADQCFSNVGDPAKGRQMPVHYGSVKYNFQTISSPLTTQLPQAAGASYAFKNAKLDEAVVKDLAQSIKDFDASAKAGAKSAADLAKINQEFANNANELTKQMAALSSNLETLNGVYGGVLNAMNRK